MAFDANQQVRLLIADVDPSNWLFTEDQIDAFLTLEGGVKRAAAQALDTIASSEALVSKVIRPQDLSTDGPKVAAELRKHAQSLRAQAAAEATSVEDDGFVFDVVELGSPRAELTGPWYG